MGNKVQNPLVLPRVEETPLAERGNESAQRWGKKITCWEIKEHEDIETCLSNACEHSSFMILKNYVV